MNPESQTPEPESEAPRYDVSLKTVPVPSADVSGVHSGVQMDRKIDHFVGGIVDFLADLARTWGVMCFRPWSAAERLLQDDDGVGNKDYVSPTAFLVVVSLVNGFFAGYSQQIGDLLGGDSHQRAEFIREVTSAFGLEFRPWVLVLGGVFMLSLYWTGRLAAKFLPAPAQRDGERIIIWFISFAATAEFVSLIAIRVLLPYLMPLFDDSMRATGGDVLGLMILALVVWIVVVVPAVVFWRWVRVYNVPIGVFRVVSILGLLGTSGLWLLFLVTHIHEQAAKSNVIAKWEQEVGVGWEDWRHWEGWTWSEEEATQIYGKTKAVPTPVWFSPDSVSTTRLEGQMINLANSPRLHCQNYYLTAIDPHSDLGLLFNFADLKRRDEGSDWLSPHGATSVEFNISKPKHRFSQKVFEDWQHGRRSAALCCFHSGEYHCLLSGKITPE